MHNSAKLVPIFVLFLQIFFMMPVLLSRSELNMDAFPLQFQQDLTYLKSSDKDNANSDNDNADASVCYTLLLC